MHDDIKNSGLGKAFGIQSRTDNLELAPFLGKLVRYKRDLLTNEFIEKNGQITIDGVFVIREVQKDYLGNPKLRGYEINNGNDFGRVIDKDEVEIITVS
jgi:hypothetical protein